MKRKNHPKDKHYLENSADSVKKCLPDNHGFLIVNQEFDNPESPVQYVSNMNREGAIKALKSLLFRWGEEEAWMKHIK